MTENYRTLPPNTIKFLAEFGRHAVPEPKIDDAYRVQRITGANGPAAFMFDGCLIDADTKFPEARPCHTP